MRVVDDFYKVGYIYQEKEMWAVFFHLESAQETMMKMIAKGVQVTGLESQKITQGDNIRGVHRTPRVRDY